MPGDVHDGLIASAAFRKVGNESILKKHFQ